MSNNRENPICVHCGACCGKAPVYRDDLPFCCNGCRTVYQLLHENKLHTYYSLETTPGIRADATDSAGRYEFLDNEEIREKILTFSEGDIARVRFFIPVIHCASCIWLLEHLERLNQGIRNSAVNFLRKEVEITFDQKSISLRQLVELLASIHYIPDLSDSLSDREKPSGGYKQLLYKIGVAGFVFINVMTYSLPAYFNGKPVDGKLGVMLAVLSYLLTIPVVFYSGSEYYIPALKNLRKGIFSIDLPIAIGIIVLFAATSADVFTGSGPGYSDSLSGLLFFLLTGKWYQGKTWEALSFERNYKSYFPIAVTKINKQVEESILLEKIEKGDILLIRNKELIPADSVLVEGRGIIDYSFVTGESYPVVREPGDFLYGGGRQTGGMIRIRVVKEVDQSHLTSLWNQDKSSLKPSESIQNITDMVSRYFTVVVLVIAVAGFLYRLAGGDFRQAIFVFTAVLIIACPCALAMSAPFTFGNTMRIFGRHGLYIKNTAVVEKLTRIDTVVFDKTGTLTWSGESRTDYTGRELTPAEKNAVLSVSRQSTHPMSLTIADYFTGCEYIPPDHFVEIPGRGVFGNAGGHDIRIGSAEYIRGISSGPGISPEVYLMIDGKEAGCFRIYNRFREGLETVISSLRKRFDLYLLSGDNAAEADKLAAYFKSDHLFFNQMPDQKAGFIKELQERGKNILMTGDGLNDAGALMQSNVALTVAGKAYHFSPASDAVMEASKFPVLERFIAFSRISKRIVYASFGISFLYNVIGIGIALAGKMSPVAAAILMPVSSVSVVAFATFVTRLAGKLYLRKK